MTGIDLISFEDLRIFLDTLTIPAMAAIQSNSNVVMINNIKGIPTNPNKPYIIQFKYQQEELVLSYNFNSEPNVYKREWTTKKWFRKIENHSEIEFITKVKFYIQFNGNRDFWGYNDTRTDDLTKIPYHIRSQIGKNSENTEIRRIRTLERNSIIRITIPMDETNPQIKEEIAKEFVVSCVDEIENITKIMFKAITQTKIEQLRRSE